MLSTETSLIILTSISYVYFWLYFSQNNFECKTESIRKMNIAYGHKKINNMQYEKERRQVWDQAREVKFQRMLMEGRRRNENTSYSAMLNIAESVPPPEPVPSNYENSIVTQYNRTTCH